jgi:hypothetical protein
MMPDDIRHKDLRILWQDIRIDIRFSSPAAGRSLLLYGWLYSLGMPEMHEKMSGW